MIVQEQIKTYINSQPEPKRNEIQTLHDIIIEMRPACELWFLDGKNSDNKVVSNPNIGYGFYTIHYADSTTKPFYQIGISANTTGISIYIMGLNDKSYLSNTYSETLGKASVTGYCIKFKTLKYINIDVLKSAIQFGFEAHNEEIN
jgi:hypothetical protein